MPLPKPSPTGESRKDLRESINDRFSRSLEALDDDPIVAQGFIDAGRGHTCCPYGTPDARQRWARGYDSNSDAKLPRFGKIKRKRSR